MDHDQWALEADRPAFGMQPKVFAVGVAGMTLLRISEDAFILSIRDGLIAPLTNGVDCRVVV